MIAIRPERDALLTDHARTLLANHYLLPGEEPQQGFARAATAWSGADPLLAQRLYDAVSQLHFMYASPVLSNAPKGGETVKALPISCFLNYVPDSIEGLNDHTVETRWLAVLGGGVGGHWSRVRSVSDKAPGPIPFMHCMDADMGAYRQGKVRRGSYAAYLDMAHPDIEEFLTIRQPTGDANRKCLGSGFHHAVNVTDAFMLAVERDQPWSLIDPNDGTVRKTLRARELWERLMEVRYRTGEPYICFIDTANRALPEPLKRRGLRINGSNLCSEIMLPTAADRTAVCCLSSLNLEFYDEWAGTGLVGDMIEMLDNVLQHFIDNAPAALWRAKHSAERERSLGLGVMGWHAYLQRRMIAFDSHEALEINRAIFDALRAEARLRSYRLGAERGEAPDMEGTGLRNAHLFAIAPTANSATIAATSPSIELAKGNAYTHRTRAGSHLVKNRYLEMLLESKGKNTEGVWRQIILGDPSRGYRPGSVQHLDCLTDAEKAVFKTAIEVDQRWVVEHAAGRQPFIDQGQSVNLFFPPRADRSYVHSVHMDAWRRGLKAVYYARTESSVSVDAVGQKMERHKLVDTGETEAAAKVQPVATEPAGCMACEG